MYVPFMSSDEKARRQKVRFGPRRIFEINVAVVYLGLTQKYAFFLEYGLKSMIHTPFRSLKSTSCISYHETTPVEMNRRNRDSSVFLYEKHSCFS
jgi:hypothetical protein